MRRSRLVGRPVERSLITPGAGEGGGGGLRSSRHSEATAGPTRVAMRRTTSTFLSRPPRRTVTVSPTRTGVDALVTPPLTAT